MSLTKTYVRGNREILGSVTSRSCVVELRNVFAIFAESVDEDVESQVFPFLLIMIDLVVFFPPELVECGELLLKSPVCFLWWKVWGFGRRSHWSSGRHSSYCVRFIPKDATTVSGRTVSSKPMNKSAKEVPLAPRLVKTTQAAEYLAISQWKLGNLVQQGLIPYIEDGGGTSPWRFDVRDLDAYIERSRRIL